MASSYGAGTLAVAPGPPGAPPAYPGYPPPAGYPGYPPPAHGYPPPGHGHPPAPSSAPDAPPGYGHYPPPPGYGYPSHPGYPPHPGYAPPPVGYGAPPGYGYPPGYPPHPGYPPYGYPPHPGYAYPMPPGYGRGRDRSCSRSPARGGAKYTCRFFIGIPNDDDFHVVKRIIGHGGGNMKDIVSRSGGDAKLRLRGKGSGYVERDLKVESTEPLQLCISCPRQDGYDIAMRGAKELLEEVYEEHRKWNADRGLPDTTPTIHMSEKHHHGENGGGQNFRNRSRSPKRQKKKNQQRSHGLPLHAVCDSPSDNTPAPPDAPSVEEIRRLIGERNDARRRGDFKEADRIRDTLRTRKVVLSDEKGQHGEAQHVTSWRYWTD